MHFVMEFQQLVAPFQLPMRYLAKRLVPNLLATYPEL
jgi:hypothetical protein